VRLKYAIPVIIFFLFACHKDYVIFKESQKVDPSGWTYTDSLLFTLNIPDTTDRYGLYLDLTHDKDFNYQNVYLQLHTYYPGEQGSSGLVSVQLQDPQAQWQGDCSGSSCDLEIILKDPVRFNKLGDYNIIVTQASREENLQGIGSVGLTLERK